LACGPHYRLGMIRVIPAGYILLAEAKKCGGSYSSCPAIFLSPDDTVVFIGREVEPDLRRQIANRIGPDEDAVQVDVELMREALRKLQSLRAERESHTVSRWKKLLNRLSFGKMLG
jgi:hypothetical protein